MWDSCQLSISIIYSVFSWSQVCRACVDTFTTAFLVYRWRNMPQSQHKLCVWVQHEGHPLRAVNALRSHWQKNKWRTQLQNYIGSEYPEAAGRPMSGIKPRLHDWLFAALYLDGGTSCFTHTLGVVCYSGVITVTPETWLPTSWCLFATGRANGTRRTGSAAGLMLTWARQARSRRGEAARLWKVRRNPRHVWNQTHCFDCIRASGSASQMFSNEHEGTRCIFFRSHCKLSLYCSFKEQKGKGEQTHK